MESSPNLIKAIAPATCPHCGEDIFICHQQTPPTLNWVLKEEDVKTAKEELLKHLDTISVEESEKVAILEWINDEETVFGPEDVMSIIQQIKEGQKNEQ